MGSGIQIERLYDEIRYRGRAALQARTREIYSRVPELEKLPDERKSIVKKLAEREIGPETASEQIRLLKEKEQKLLLENGYPVDALEMRYRCPACRDTGWTGEAKRRPCSCRLLLMASLDPDIGINDREVFEKVSETVYSDPEQKKRTLKAMKWAEKYADSLPSPDKPNIVFMGMTGLGKSYLSNAIAYRALQKGIEAKRITAYAFVQEMLRAIQERRNGTDEIYTTVPLLVIDDLGSEPVIPNVTEETLFSVLNERINKRLPTIVATNLSVTALQDRYGERVTSRLLDANLVQAVLLTGDNLRRNDRTC